jgi:hypothetical protein
MLEQPPDLAVASLVQRHPEPGVTPLAGLRLDAIETGGPILQDHATQQALKHRRGWRAPQPHAVFALDLTRGMHEPVRQLAIVGEEQQPRSVDVQPADDDPAARRGRWLSL